MLRSQLTFIVILSCIIALCSWSVDARAGRVHHRYGQSANSQTSNYNNNYGHFRRSHSFDKETPRENDQGGQQLSPYESRHRSLTRPDNSGGESRLNLTGVKLANDHLLKIRQNHRCRHPRPRLVRVKDYYIGADKVYLPR